MLSPAALSALVLFATLAMFVSERVRHDLVAVLSLLACLALGLVKPKEAFSGFGDPAVVTVAAVLVIGRAIELSGAAAVIARRLIPPRLPFALRLAMLLGIGAALSAFMNNIAALVITIPIAADVARSSRLPPGAVLMPLAFATILGGMTTLIGTPANLILSSVRAERLGAPFGFFTMAPVGIAVTVVGLAYLAFIGWRLLPVRQSHARTLGLPWRTFELNVPTALTEMRMGDLAARLRAASARTIALFRGGRDTRFTADTELRSGDRLLMIARASPRDVAEQSELTGPADPADTSDVVTAHVVVGHGSFLVGLTQEEVRLRSGGKVRVIASGPRAARQRRPLATLEIAAGDQLFVRGGQNDLADFITRSRLLEIDRLDYAMASRTRSAAIVAIFAGAIALVVSGLIGPAIAFVGATALIATLRLIPSDEVYRSIDWSVILLLAAMIPVGQSFETSGAADITARWLGYALSGAPVPVVIGAVCAITMLLSIFLNNVACAVIMGPLAIALAQIVQISPDAILLAVLIGTSSDFLTPIGHQNNLLVMGPGGYRFSDYSRVGGILVVLVILTTALVLSALYG